MKTQNPVQKICFVLKRNSFFYSARMHYVIVSQDFPHCISANKAALVSLRNLLRPPNVWTVVYKLAKNAIKKNPELSYTSMFANIKLNLRTEMQRCDYIFEQFDLI